MKLLIVEDNPTVRHLIRSIVENLADEIRECEDGAEAIEAYTAQQPDWVLMDIALKNSNGIVATSRIIATYPAARIIIVTSYDAADLRDASRAAGACGYVLKDDLYELQQILGQPGPSLGDAGQ